MVVAGPGSGKTRMLTHRIAHLVAERGVTAASCLAITFTRRAAAEMRARLQRLLPTGAKDVPIRTFHALGLKILRDDPDAAGLVPGFTVAGETERAALLAATLDISNDKATRLLARIAKAKRSGARDNKDDTALAETLAAYERAMRAKNSIDFDDCVTLAAKALERNPALAARWRGRFQFILVDEFQDVDAEQYRLLTLIAPQSGNVLVVGDPDQAIYGFRGGDSASFACFAADFPAARTLHLRRNYRSSGTIVEAASQVIGPAHATPKLAEIVRDMHEKIDIHVAPTEAAEAEYVVASIEKLLGGHSFFSIDTGRTEAGERSLGFGDIAVLYRTEAQSAALVEAFARSGMPFATSRRRPLAENPAVAALLAELDALPADHPLADSLRLAATGLTTRASADDADPVTSPSRGRLGGSLDPAALSEALRWLTALAGQSGDDRARFLEAIALADEADFFDPRADRVALLTMHAAKGLEFPVVFIVGLEDGVMPLAFGASDEKSVAEERRLFFVAMTRAKDRLFLSRAGSRLWRGKVRKLEASPFLTDIEAELLKLQPAALPRRRPEAMQLALF